MKTLLVSAPFGNYYQLLSKIIETDFTPVLGTYTWQPRGFFTKPYGGLVLRTLLTLRYNEKAYFNRIGLKNPGIRSLKKGDYSDKIISIYGWTDDEWDNLFKTVKDLNPEAVEINASCPNIEKSPFTKHFFEKYFDKKLNLIVKIPPVNYLQLVEMAYGAGIRTFHCCNTLPTPNGGMSGKALLPISQAVVRHLRNIYTDIKIIGGGGITTVSDANDYMNLGANHVAIGTMLFNPLNWKNF